MPEREDCVVSASIETFEKLGAFEPERYLWLAEALDAEERARATLGPR